MRLKEHPARLDAIAKLVVSESSFQLLKMQPSIQKIDFGVLGSQFNLSESVTSRLEISFSDLMRDYEGLANSFQDILSVFEFPKFVLPWATRGVYTAANALELLQPIEDTEDDSATEVDPRVEIGVGEGNLVELLGDLDPSLVQVYTGAYQALQGDNPDRQRHVLTSLRTLWDEVFRLLAPIGDVLTWVSSRGLTDQDYLYEGKPTRRAKLEYVLRYISAKPLSKFVKADIEAEIRLRNLYDRIHRAKPGINEHQLCAIVLNSKTSLEYFISVWTWSTDNE